VSTEIAAAAPASLHEVEQRASAYAREVVRPRAAQMARGGGAFPRELVSEAANRGLAGLLVPQRYGGSNAGHLAFARMIEAVARECASSAVIVDVHVSVAAEPIVGYGSEEQKQRWLPALCSATALGAFALTEPGSGSDAAALRTAATRRGDGFVLRGSKAFITNAGAADLYIVMARTGGEGARGISAFLVEASRPGVRAGEPLRKMGLRGSWTAELHLDDVAVPASAMLGQEGQGFRIAMSALDSGRIGISAQAVGIAQGALDTAVHELRRHSTSRESPPQVLADMAAQIEAARALCAHAAAMCDAGEPFTAEAAVAKLVATDTAMAVAQAAAELCAPASASEDHPAAIRLRDAKACQIYEGTNQVQRMVIARALLARDAAPARRSPRAAP
jgi:alkylation response protein AidB-like acyl-CoA dehydrogenase